MHRIRRRLTYANVMTTVLLFLVLGGGSAYALTGSNTIFSNDIVNGQVKAPDLASQPVGAVFARINRLSSSQGTTFGAVSGASDINLSEASVATVSPGPNTPIVARALVVKLTAPPNGPCPGGANCFRRFILRDDGADTPVRCTITGTQTSCNSGRTSAAIASGSKLAIKTTASGGPKTADALIGWSAGTP
jgi:hypothetical protein